MGRCFVIQPFDDGGPYDRRYDDVFKLAIQSADLEPYRVDRDPSVSIPIEQIESEIRNADICLAEITTDNPNVWFELGFAIAVPKEVVLVCSQERNTHFPFDVQHRNIVKYKTEAPSDFNELQTMVTTRLRAAVNKQAKLGALRSSPIVDTAGLSQHEIVALVTVMQNRLIPTQSVAPGTIQQDMNKFGFTDIAVSLALQSLCDKKLLVPVSESGWDSREYDAFQITDSGIQWLFNNQDKLLLKKPANDIPF